MPAKHTRNTRERLAFHVYNRRPGGRELFSDREDRQVFLSLLARHLSPEPKANRHGRPWAYLRDRVVAMAFCVMTTHFHLVLFQRDEGAVADLMNHVLTAYTWHHRAKYGETGPLYEDRYRAKPIRSARYFRWLIACVHDNHPSGLDYEFSSHRAFVDDHHRPPWLIIQPAIRTFGGATGYAEYLASRREFKRVGAEL